MAASETILSVKDLRVRFRTLDGAVEAVKGINIHVNAGETVAVVGESGSGTPRPRNDRKLSRMMTCGTSSVM